MSLGIGRLIALVGLSMMVVVQEVARQMEEDLLLLLWMVGVFDVHQ